MELAAVLTSGSVGGITLLTLLAKFLMKTYRTEQLDTATNNSATSAFKRMQEEIDKLSKRCEELENRIDKLRDLELDGAADMATLIVYIRQMPCGNCTAPSGTFAEIEAILERLIARRKEKSDIIKNSASTTPTATTPE